MQKTTLEIAAPSLHHPLPASHREERVLNVSVVYEDAEACQWARDTCEQKFSGIGKETVHYTWWKLEELSEPAVLAGAVSKAMRADVIVVATTATEGFPLPFYVWVRSWLPHRLLGTGELVALVTKPREPSFQMNRAVEYLRAIARQAPMRFQIIERAVPCVTPWIFEERSRRLHRAALVPSRGTPALLARRPLRRQPL